MNYQKQEKYMFGIVALAVGLVGGLVTSVAFINEAIGPEASAQAYSSLITAPTFSFVSNPTLALAYDSYSKESALNARAVIDITAGSHPLNLANINMLMLSTASSSQGVSPETFSVVSNTSNIIKTTVVGKPSYYVIPAGVKARFTLTSVTNPKKLFGGSYTASLPFVYMANYDAYGGVQYSTYTGPSGVSNSVKVFGETSPYITSAVYDAGKLIINGVRIKAGQTLIIDEFVAKKTIVLTSGTGLSSNEKIVVDISNFVFPPADYHDISILDSVTGKSNRVGFKIIETTATSTVKAPVLTASPASGTLTGASPTLWVDFNLSNYSPKGDELIYFGDGNKSALGYKTATDSRYDYHKSGTYTVSVMSGSLTIAQTKVVVNPATSTVSSISWVANQPIVESRNNKLSSTFATKSTLGIFLLRGDNGASTITKVTVPILSSITSPATLYLYDGATLLDTRSISTNASSTQVVFSNLKVPVGIGSLKALEVRIEMPSSAVSGSSVKIGDVVAVEYIKSDNTVAISKIAGASFNPQYFFNAIPNITFVSGTSSVTKSSTGSVIDVRSRFTFKVKPQGGSMTAFAQNGSDFMIATSTNGPALAVSKLVTVTPNHTQYSEGVEYTVTLDVIAPKTAFVTGSSNTVYIKGINWRIYPSSATQTWGLGNFKTNSVIVADAQKESFTASVLNGFSSVINKIINIFTN